jgi:hypothetical protein
VSITGTESAQVLVEVMEVPLDPIVSGMLISAEVDLSLYVPSQFRLVFRGPRMKVLELGGFQLGALVNIQVTTGTVPLPLMTSGEVTAVDVEYGPDGNLTVVRGLDASHRLMRGTNTMAYPEMLASDVVEILTSTAVIPPGEIIPTDTLYEWLTQANVSDWVCIQQLAALENRVAYVDAEGLFNFCPAPLPEEGVPPAVSLDEPPIGTQLVMGQNLIRLRGTVSGAEQVPEVNVLGYDPLLATPVVGMTPAIPAASQSLDPATLPIVVAGEFEAWPFTDTSRPFDNEAAAMNRALSIASDISCALAEVEGECIGDPTIAPGGTVSLGMVGPPFDGYYVVTSARHVFEPNLSGYSTWFTVGGRRDRSLYALTSGSSGIADVKHPTVPGVVIGTVVDNMDPEEMCRVKVMFPWLAETYVSAWARTMQIGAGALGGFVWMPEVGNEVLVSFDRGDMNFPYVIGNLYNGIQRPVPPPQIDGVVAARTITSRAEHMIRFDDGPDTLAITIATGGNTCMIMLDDEEQVISVTCAGEVTINAAEGVTIQAGGDLALSAGGDFSVMAGGAVNLGASGEASIDSAGGVTINSPTVNVSAAEISLGP